MCSSFLWLLISPPSFMNGISKRQLDPFHLLLITCALISYSINLLVYFLSSQSNTASCLTSGGCRGSAWWRGWRRAWWRRLGMAGVRAAGAWKGGTRGRWVHVPDGDVGECRAAGGREGAECEAGEAAGSQVKVPGVAEPRRGARGASAQSVGCLLYSTTLHRLGSRLSALWEWHGLRR